MAGPKVFVSYQHDEKEWVRGRLIPCLQAAGAEVLADYLRFGAGLALPAQMDALVDEADVNLLVLTPAYLTSAACQREMARAIGRDPAFSAGRTLPVIRKKCPLPPPIAAANPLYVSLEDDGVPERWQEVFKAVKVEGLGATGPTWLQVRDDAARHLLDRGAVFVEVGEGVAWPGLVASVRSKVPGLKEIDLERGATASRRGLVEQILKEAGSPRAVPASPEDLVTLDAALTRLGHTKLVFAHFDRAGTRADYGNDLFDTLRYLIEAGHLSPLFISRRPFFELVPKDHPLSRLTNLVNLRLEKGV